MIIGDALTAPNEKSDVLRLSAKELLTGYRRRAFHMREDGDGLVVAEGEAVDFTLPAVGTRPRPTGIAAVADRVFAFDPSLQYVYLMKKDKSGHEYIYANTYEPYRILHYNNSAGNDEFYCVTEKNVLQFLSSNTITVAQNKGGACAAVFHDRLFTANGSRVFYSAPLNLRSWTETRYGAGRLELVSEGAGEILDMQPLKDNLYLMRRHGITCLRALGDELNFKAVHLPMKRGGLVKRSVALCGERIAYFTDCGLYLFNGASSVLAENSRFGEIDFSKPVKAVSFHGRYYALVTRFAGGSAIYCYDPETCEGHFIENGASDIAAGDELYFTRGILAYRLTERGVSQNFTPCLTAENVAFGLGGEKTLKAVAIEGEGAFRIDVSSNRGTRTVRGKANGALKLRSPLRGSKFDLRISVENGEEDEARFRAILLRFTEDGYDD